MDPFEHWEDSVTTATSLGPTLRQFFRAKPEEARQLFWEGKTISSGKIPAAIRTSGLVESTGAGMNSRVQLYEDQNLLLATDRPEYQGMDRVFPIFSDENVILARLIASRPWHSVLDLGSGCGVLAIVAAKNGATVQGIDASPRAIKVSRWNAELNEVAAEFTLSRIDTALLHGKWDLIVSNPPFTPTPTTDAFHIAGNGGRTGTETLVDVLKIWEGALRSGSTCMMTALSLTKSSGEMLVEQLARQSLGPHQQVFTHSIYGNRIPVSELAARFAPWDSSHQWYASLLRSDYAFVDYICLLAGRHAEILYAHLKGMTIEKWRYAGSWSRRLRRYDLWTQPHENNASLHDRESR